MSEEIRCTAPHPRAPARECRAVLVDVISGSVAVVRATAPAAVLEYGPGSVGVQCPRCGAPYVVLPLPVASERAAG